MFYLFAANYLAFGLILFGLAFIIAEAFITSFGILGLLGAIAFIAGAILLIEGPSIGYAMPIYFIILLALLVLALVFLITIFTWRSQHRPVISGREALIGSHGKITQTDQKNWIHIEGERWQCESQFPLHTGEEVVIEDLKGLICIVKPVHSGEKKV